MPFNMYKPTGHVGDAGCAGGSDYAYSITIFGEEETMSHTTESYPPGYFIGADGHVFSTASNWRGYGSREMNQTLSDGYPSV